MKSIRQKAYLALLVNAVLWGIATPIIKNAMDYVSPVYFLTYRFMIVILLITPIFLIYLKKTKTKVKNIKSLFIAGFLSNPLNLLLLFIGLNLTSALDASVLSSLYPVFFTVACVIALKEKVTKQEKIGLSIALFGTLIFTIQPILSQAEINQASLPGNLIIILGQVAYIIAMIINKKQAQKNKPFVQAYFAWASAFIFFIPLAFLTKEVNPSQIFNIVQSPALPNILYMAIFGSIIAFFAYLYGQSKIEASEAAVFTYLQPLFAAPLAVFWLNEKITTPFIIGFSLIILGVIIAETRKIIIK